MSDAIRPSGLTVLAIINYVMGALAAMSVIFMTVVAITMLSGGAEGDLGEMIKPFEQMGRPLFIASYLGATASAALQLLSARGFMRMRRFSGYFLGNAYAVVAVAGAALGAYITTLNPEVSMGFNMFTVVNLVYPLLLLFLLNFIFREDFVR